MAVDPKAITLLERVIDGKAAQARPAEVRIPATVDGVDADGTVWVLFAGATAPTPATSSTVAVSRGDEVAVTVGGWRATIDGNATRPATDDSKASYALKTARDAGRTAEQAAEDAAVARESAESAVADAERASVAAGQAADSARSAAASASSAATSAAQAVSDAATASQAAQSAQADAASASQSASSAASSAASASADAASARSDATAANRAANDALTQLSTVQDVVGVLDWAAEHGTYSLTSDTAVQPDKMYFSRTGSGTAADPYVYAPVAEPVDAGLSGYYELSVDEAMQSYIMSHLALTDEGLWVTKDGSGYKILLSSTGVSVVDPQGHTVSTFGESISFDSSRPQYIGGEDAFIAWYDSDDDGAPDSLWIGGGNIKMGSTTLSQVLEDVTDSRQLAQQAVDTAMDVPVLAISSTNGTVFKRNLGVSTTLVATVFTPGGRISTPSELAARFGSGAYLEWGWRDAATGVERVISASDPRISQGGFAFTVGPSDIDVQAVLTCSLNY